MSAGPLTEEGFWHERHLAGAPGYTFPRPRTYFLDCELAAVFERHLRPVRGKDVLEVGCGSSVWLPYFSLVHGMSVHGIDCSAEGLERSRRILSVNGVEGELVLGDLFALAQESSRRFSCVFSLGLVEHFADPGSVVATLSRCLEPGGLLITWAPNLESLILRASCRLNPAIRRTYTIFGLGSLNHFHRQAGLEVVESRHLQFLDLTLLNLGRLPRFWQVWLSRTFRAVSLPFVSLAGWLGIRVQSSALCGGMVTVARRPV